MFCTQCGNEIEQHARFCSKCGKEAAASSTAVAATPAAPKKKDPDMAMHITILGWLLVGSAILTGIGGLVVMFAGQFMRHLPIPMGDMPAGIPPFVSWITSVVGLSILTVAAGTAAAGVGLLEYRSWARVFAIIVAVFLIFHFPIGTAIAIYAFWVLFSKEGQEYYKSRSESTMTARGT